MLDNTELVRKWVDKFPAQNSKDTAHKVLVQYEKYLKQNSLSNTEYIEMLNQDEIKKFMMLNQFIGSLDIAPSSIRQTWSFIKSWLRWNRIKITQEDRKEFIKFKPIEKINRKPLTKEIIKSIITESTKYYKTLFLLQVSSGNRISETLHLTKEDFDFKLNPISAVIQAKFTKTKRERDCFFSKEAYHSLEKYGIDSFFSDAKKLNAVEWYFWKIRGNLGFNDRYSNGTHHVNIHSFRAYFRTMSIKANIHQDLAESLIGHTGYLKQYVRPEKSDLQKAYLKLEPYLKIF